MKSFTLYHPRSRVLRLALFVLFGFATIAGAATVTNANDSGAGSLRDAIANAAGGDTITFDSSLNGSTITLVSGQLVIDKNLTITGPGADLLTISGNHASRVFAVNSAATAALNNLKIANGKFTNASNNPVVGGAGIYNAGTLTLSACAVTDNQQLSSDPNIYNFGGGIFNRGSLSIINSTMSGNSVSGPAVNRGGAITNYIFDTAGQLIAPLPKVTITTSTIQNNSLNGGAGSGENGAGIDNEGGDVVVSGSTITSNTCTAATGGNNGGGGSGGGISSNGGTLQVTDSIVSNNTVNGPGQTTGGGIDAENDAVVGIARTTIAGNSVNGNGGGGGVFAGGNASVAPFVSIYASTISNNTAHTLGGGIWLNTQTFGSPQVIVALGNSTVSGNTAVGGNAPGGGGIANNVGILSLSNCTVTNNSVADGSITVGRGGGVFGLTGFSYVTAANTIIAGNTASVGKDVYAAFSSQSHNLIGELDGSFGGDPTGMLLNAREAFQPLSNYGGPNKTMKLLGNTAIDTGGDLRVLLSSIDNSSTSFDVTTHNNNSGADVYPFPGGLGVTIQVDSEQMTVTSSSGSTVTAVRGANGTTAAAHNAGAGVNFAFDQRGSGFTRNSGNAPDMGAFELHSLMVTNTQDSGAGSLRDTIAATPSLDHAITFSIPTSDPNYQSGVYTIHLSSAELAFPTDTIIVGPTSDTLTIKRNSAAPAFRIFDIAGGLNVAISGVTITGGKSPDNGDGGGGILNSGTLLLDDTAIKNCTAGANSNGGGISNIVSGATSSLTISYSTLSDNSTSGNGGGISNSITNGTGSVTINYSTFSGNSTGAIQHGGAMSNEVSSSSGSASLSLVINHSTIASNTAGLGGGGIVAVGLGTGGTTVDLSITASTIYGNSLSNAGGIGGGIDLISHDTAACSLELTNSTISGNSGQGGGIFLSEQQPSTTTATIQSSTITKNASNKGGGGVFLLGATMTLKDSIVAGNTSDDISGNVDSSSSSYNLVGPTGSGGLTNGVNHNHIVANPLLSPLGSYGGVTQTHALLPGSPAIDAGTATGAPGADQRGIVRVGATDIGAFESSGFNILVTSGDGQSATVNTAFGAPLVATVLSLDGAPVAGGVVTFTAPASGASATFGESNIFSTTIGADGTASATPKANSIGGQSYTVNATTVGAAGYAAFYLGNSKANQTISFAQLPNKTYGDADFIVEATASSGLPVTFSASGSCAMTGANTVHLTGAGSCSVTASQNAKDKSGNDSPTYNAATPITRTFTVAKAPTTIVVTSTPNPSKAGQAVKFTATVSSKVSGITGTVEFRDGNKQLGTVGLNASGVASLTTNALTAGKHTITAIYAGDNNFAGSSGALSGTQQVTATPTPTPTPTPAARPLNISTRMEVLTKDNVLIAGFIVTGQPNTTKKVMIRGLGPSLVNQGVGPGLVLTDPLLELHGPAGFGTITNNNWQDGSNTSDIPAGFQPSDPRESVIIAVLPIDASGVGKYTAILRGANGEQGIGLVEAYDLESGTGQFANISTRGFIDTGDNVMIGGFILGGSSEGSKVLILAKGPSLAGQGVAGALPDPTLEIHDKQGNKIRSNDNWKIDDATGRSQEAAISATTVAPNNELESGILDTFPPGQYTAIVAGKSGGTGVGLVEIYNLN